MGKEMKLEQIKLSRKAPTKLSEKAKTKDILPQDPVGTTYRCTCCGKFYDQQKNNFNTSPSPLYAGNNGYVSICKNCADKYFDGLTSFFSGNAVKAIDRMAQLFDWYYSDSLLETAMKLGVSSPVSAYGRSLNLSHTKTFSKSYIDTIRDRTEEGIQSIEELAEHNSDTEEIVSPEVTDFFGFGYTPEEYKFLKTQYDDWVTRHECNTKAQEELFKNLCIAQLNIQKAQRAGGDKVDDAMKTFQALLGTANLKPTQTNMNALADQNTFGTLIKKWENEDPIPEPAEEWKDVDGIVKYISVYFLGHLCKMLGLKNRYSKMYEDEMQKYKVEKPEYEDDDEALFDAVFGEQSDGDGNGTAE